MIRCPETKITQEDDTIAVRVYASRSEHTANPDYRRQCEARSQSAIRSVLDRPDWPRPCTLHIVMHAPYWNDAVLASRDQVLLATIITVEEHAQ